MHVASLVVTFAATVWLGRTEWFRGDEWAFIGGRGLAAGNASWLEPHNEHWVTSPILIYKLLYSVWALRSYTPYIVVVGLFHLCVMHFAFRLARRAGAEPWPAVAITTAFGLSASAPSIVFFPFNLAFAGAATLGLLHLLLVDHDGGLDRRDALAAGAGLVALTFSGVAIPLLGVSTIVVLVRRGWRLALVTAGPPAAVYLTWFTIWGHTGLKAGRSYNPWEIASYVASGVAATARVWTARSWLGVAALLVLFVWLIVCCRRWRDPQWRAQSTLQLALTAGVVALFATIAVGRASFAPAEATRYSYVALALLVAPAAALLTAIAAPVRRLAHGAVFVALLSLLAVVLPISYGIHAFRTSSAAGTVETQKLHRFIVASVSLFRQGEPAVADQLHIETNPGVTVEFLRALSRGNDLGDQIPTANETRLAAALLQVVVSTDERELPGAVAATVRSVDGADVRDAGSGCMTVVKRSAASVTVRVESAGATKFSVVTAADVDVALVDAQAGSTPRITTVRGAAAPKRTEQRWWVELNWNGSVELTINRGPATLCGVGR